MFVGISRIVGATHAEGCTVDSHTADGPSASWYQLAVHRPLQPNHSCDGKAEAFGYPFPRTTTNQQRDEYNRTEQHSCAHEDRPTIFLFF